VRWSDPLPAVAGAFAVAVGLYLLVVLAFRVGERRTVAELAPFDLAAIIATGAVVGGTATGRNSITVGVTAVAGLLLAHALVTRLRRLPGARRLVDQAPVVLVHRGVVQPQGLRRAGLASQDLSAALRARGVRDLHSVELAVFETRSGGSVLLGPGQAPLWNELRPDDAKDPLREPAARGDEHGPP